MRVHGRRALAPLVLSGVLLLTTACNGSGEVASGDPGPGPSSGAPTSGTPVPSVDPSGAVADPDHAVAMPGPLTDRLYPADLLVYSQDTLSAEAIKAIKAIKGVQAVESLSLAQVSVEDKQLNIAAVDPATYRNFTPDESRRTQQVWDRVAGGEIAVLRTLGKKLPETDQGYVKLGNGAQAPEVHIGAYAPQIPKVVDAVVNDTWAATLGMQDGNALIVSMDITSPQSVRKPIQRIVGADASVQILGPDLPIGAVRTAFVVGSVADAVGTFNYTVLAAGRIAPEASWVSAHIVTGEVPILGDVTCNRAIFPQLREALSEVVQRGLADKIHPDEYAGCYYPRFIAGTTTLSNHSFGLALDLNTPGNQRGTVGEMDRDVVAIFKKWGFTWGGDWRYTDPMHFEMNAIVDPR